MPSIRDDPQFRAAYRDAYSLPPDPPLPVRGACTPEEAPIVEASLRALYLTPIPTISLSAYLAMKTRAEWAEAQLAEAGEILAIRQERLDLAKSQQAQRQTWNHV